MEARVIPYKQRYQRVTVTEVSINAHTSSCPKPHAYACAYTYTYAHSGRRSDVASDHHVPCQWGQGDHQPDSWAGWDVPGGPGGNRHRPSKRRLRVCAVVRSNGLHGEPHDGRDERQHQLGGLLRRHSTNAYTYANTRTYSDSPHAHASADRYVGARHPCGFRPNRRSHTPRSRRWIHPHVRQ